MTLEPADDFLKADDVLGRSLLEQEVVDRHAERVQQSDLLSAQIALAVGRAPSDVQRKAAGWELDLAVSQQDSVGASVWLFKHRAILADSQDSLRSSKSDLNGTQIGEVVLLGNDHGRLGVNQSTAIGELVPVSDDVWKRWLHILWLQLHDGLRRGKELRPSRVSLEYVLLLIELPQLRNDGLSVQLVLRHKPASVVLELAVAVVEEFDLESSANLESVLDDGVDVAQHQLLLPAGIHPFAELIVNKADSDEVRIQGTILPEQIARLLLSGNRVVHQSRGDIHPPLEDVSRTRRYSVEFLPGPFIDRQVFEVLSQQLVRRILGVDLLEQVDVVDQE